VQALIDNLVERGLNPAAPRPFIIDGSKALSKAIRATFGREAAIQRCQIHKARNIMDRLPKSMHAQVRCVLRQGWEMDDADKAETLLRNLARRLEKDQLGLTAIARKLGISRGSVYGIITKARAKRSKIF